MHTISRHDVVILFELINKCARCINEPDYHQLMCRMKALIPYENALSVLGRIQQNGDMTYHAVTINCSMRGRQTALGSCDHHDAIMKKKYAGYRVQYWEDILGADTIKKDSIVVSYSAEKNHSFTHDVKVRRGGMQGSLFSLSGQGIKRTKRTERILSLAGPHLHYALMRALKRSHSTKDMLTPKEKEAIKWLKQGKSTWDMAAILRISERTVKFHISNIMQKLGASNRANAVAIAIEQGIVD